VDCSKASFRLLAITSVLVGSRSKRADLPVVVQQTYLTPATNWRRHGTDESQRSGTFRLRIGDARSWRVRVTDS
jgi:hypothetical protein